MSFIKSNYMFFLWGIAYLAILLAICHEEPAAFWMLLVLEIISLIVAFSPAGEWLLRKTSGAKKIKTSRDKEYLLPLFESVYEDAKSQKPKISKNINIFFEDTKEPNAFAIGSNTVAVTRGAIDTFSEEELKGVIAHELGHLYNGDTKASLVMTVGNGVLSLLILSVKLILRLFDRDTLLLIMVINALVGVIIQVVLSIGQRKNEYMADRFAFEIGYGAELIEGLYLLRDMQASDRRRLIDRLRASHPDLDNRIARLEQMQMITA